ncbi:MAG: hypothetical protein ASARMPREDX12_007484 [Alectoria sarmentosa]|nr:MAG: hypothetical protein ASARMPREDX12_007484 [Alectoria sarmentosa]
MEEPTVYVITIPYTGAPLEVVKLPLTPYTRMEDATIESWYHEKYLHRLPDLTGSIGWHLGYGGPKSCGTHRALVDLGTMDPHQIPQEGSKQPRGPYFMYKCVADRGASTLNKWFEEAGAAHVFGAAVIFKVKEPTFDDHGEVVYDHLDRHSIENAFEGKGIATDESLKWLAAQ